MPTRTITSTPIFSQPLFSDNTSSVVLGMAVRKCLDSWTEGHPKPTREELKRINDPLIELAGEKSSKSFFIKISYVPAKQVDSTLSFYPTINNGWKAGFAAVESGPIVLEKIHEKTDLEIGEALLIALSQSSDKPTIDIQEA